jgi:hypothetical protein
MINKPQHNNNGSTKIAGVIIIGLVMAESAPFFKYKQPGTLNTTPWQYLQAQAWNLFTVSKINLDIVCHMAHEGDTWKWMPGCLIEP